MPITEEQLCARMHFVNESICNAIDFVALQKVENMEQLRACFSEDDWNAFMRTVVDGTRILEKMRKENS